MTYTIHECVLKQNKGKYLIVDNGWVINKYFNSIKKAIEYMENKRN